MKRFVHPHLTKSILQWKDGSTHLKHWILYKPVLYLESDTSSNSFVKNTKKKPKGSF